MARIPSIHVLTFALPNGDALAFLPGQYVTFYLERNGKTLPRSYSIYSSPKRHDRFSLLIKVVPDGFASPYLCGLSSPSSLPLSVLAPLGRFILHDPSGRSVVLVATGVGLAPFLPMLESLHENHPATPTTLFVGNRFVEEIVDRDRLTNLAKDWPSFRFVPVLSRPPSDGSWTGEVGHVEDPVRVLFPDLAQSDVYLCGATPMVNQMQELALTLNCPKDHVFVDRWGEHSG